MERSNNRSSQSGCKRQQTYLVIGSELRIEHWSDLGSVSAFASTKSRFRIRFEIPAGLSKLKSLDKFVGVKDAVRFTRPIAAGKVFNDLGSENDFLPALYLVDVLVHKALTMKLPEYEFLSRRVVTEHSPVFVNFALGVLFLRRISRLVAYVQKLI